MEYSFYHNYKIQIRFNDIDLLGHVTNSAYPQFFDLGRMSYFEGVLKERMNWLEEGLILASIHIDFKSQITLFDRVRVKTKIFRIGNKSISMLQELHNETTQSVAAVSKATMVAYNGRLSQPIEIPKRWRDRIVKFERDINFQE